MDGGTTENFSGPTPSLVDGMIADSVEASPPSSIGGSSRPHKKQFPIARNAGTGYERPERARTSHACEPCRERKTKCDGDRPSCRRCLHTGTTCHYGYGKGWKKRKTAEDLSITSTKLARYEELLTEIFPLVTNNIRDMITQARQNEFSMLNHNDSPDSSTPASSHAMDGEMKSGSPSLARLPLPPLPLAITQSTPNFPGSSRPLPGPLTVGGQHTQSQPANIGSTIKSPVLEDASMNPALRLPSITRHGFLVEDGTRPRMRAVTDPMSEDAQASDQNKTLVDEDSSVGANTRSPSD